MTLIKTMMAGLLGSATLLPALPAWADNTPATNASAVPAGQAAASPPATKAAPTARATSAEPGSPVTAGTPAAAAQPVGGSVSLDDSLRERMQVRLDNRKAFLDAHLAALRAGLELTPAQEPAWPPVETAIRDLADARHHMRGDRRADRSGQDASGTDRLKARAAHLVAMGQAMGKLADASGPLLRTLSSEQKQRLPVLLRGLKPHRAVALAFDVDPRFGRHWHDGFARGDGEERFMFFADRFGGRHGDGGWNPRDRHFGSPDQSGDGDGWHHRRADRGGMLMEE